MLEMPTVELNKPTFEFIKITSNSKENPLHLKMTTSRKAQIGRFPSPTKSTAATVASVFCFRSVRMIPMMMVVILTVVAAVIFGAHPASAFPDGAPGAACTRHKPNHGGSAQPLSAMPFTVTASSSTYKPGQSIAVRIAGKPGTYFKGFFVQASDERGRWIGKFEPTSFSHSHPECAATTHAENHEKEEMTLVWHAPKDSHGTVRFLASILKNYKIYWVDAPAITPDSKPSKSTSFSRRRRAAFF